MEKKKTPRGGPNSEQGKRNSSRNSTGHGMCQQRFLLLPGESPEEFAQLQASWREHYNFEDSPVVPSLVDALVEADWMQRRCTRNVAQLQLSLANAEAEHPDNIERIQFLEKRLLNAFRYRTAAENSFSRALRNLEKFRKARYDEDLKDAVFEIKSTQAFEHIYTRRHQLGMDPEIYGWKRVPFADDDGRELTGEETQRQPEPIDAA